MGRRRSTGTGADAALETRYLRGQYFTGLPLARLVTALAFRSAGVRALDPAHGPGVFLAALAERQAHLAGPGAVGRTTILGCELDESLIPRARACAPEATLVHGDFLARWAEFAPVDVIVGNPPYTRMHDCVRDDAVRAGYAAAAAHTGIELDGRASLYARFLVASLAALAPQGRLAFILPEAWLDLAGLARLRRALVSSRYRLELVIATRAECFFEDADVNACIVVVRHGGDTQGQARFVTLAAPLEALGDPVRLAESILAGQDFAGLSVRSLSHADLGKSPRWGAFVRVTAREHAALAACTRGGACIDLGELFHVERGFTTDANWFFYPPESAGLAPWRLAPLLKSPRAIRSHVVDSSACATRVLVEVTAPHEPELATWIAEGAARGVAAKKHARAGRMWYELPAQRTPTFVMAKGVWDRWVVARVAGQLAYDQQLYGLRPRVALSERELAALAGLLNTASVAAAAELTGRTNFGSGVLWLAACDVAALPILDPRRLARAELDEIVEHAQRRLASAPATRAVAFADPRARALEEAAARGAGMSARAAAQVASETIALAMALGAARAARAGR